MLPDFIGIGAPRSGTTWIYEMLKNHPRICMSKEKEINFFNTYYDKGVEWYEKFFDKCPAGSLVGEFSPSYLANGLAPGRIKELLPDVKLIISLRNPVEQVYSRYLYIVNRNMYNNTFEEALNEKPHILEGAYYYKHISRYLEYFDRRRILVLVYEDLTKDAKSFLETIYEFLEIDASFMPSTVNRRVHSTVNPKVRFVEMGMVITRSAIRKAGLYSLAEGLKKTGLIDKIRQYNMAHNDDSRKIAPATRSRLNQLFAEDKKKLSMLLDRELASWR